MFQLRVIFFPETEALREEGFESFEEAASAVIQKGLDEVLSLNSGAVISAAAIRKEAIIFYIPGIFLSNYVLNYTV